MPNTEDILVFESGVTFGPFTPEDFFYMEKSDVYKKLGTSFSTVEFLFVDEKRKFVLVEAKSSSPNPNKEETSDFDEFINEISTKFQDSYQLFLTSVSGRRRSNEIGKNVQKFRMDSSEVKFVLVIPGHRIEWLAPLKEALKRQLRKTLHMWGIDLAVMNEELAREHRLIV